MYVPRILELGTLTGAPSPGLPVGGRDGFLAVELYFTQGVNNTDHSISQSAVTVVLMCVCFEDGWSQAAVLLKAFKMLMCPMNL